VKGEPCRCVICGAFSLHGADNSHQSITPLSSEVWLLIRLQFNQLPLPVRISLRSMAAGNALTSDACCALLVHGTR
jgi:hypothetical protein